MANLGYAFNHEEVEAGRDFDNLPVGDYVAQIIESEVVPTKAGTGMMAKLTLQVMDGQYENRKLWDNINFQNPNGQAQLIGQQRLKKYCEATGHSGHLSDTEDLHFKPLRIKVGLGKTTADYPDPRNEIKDVKPLGAGSPPAGKANPTPRPASARMSSAPVASSAPPPKVAGTKPWSNRASA